MSYQPTRRRPPKESKQQPAQTAILTHLGQSVRWYRMNPIGNTAHDRYPSEASNLVESSEPSV